MEGTSLVRAWSRPSGRARRHVWPPRTVAERVSRALPSLPAVERRSHARDASPRLPRGSARAARARSSLAAIVNCFSTGARSRRISLASPRSHRACGTINGRNAREAAEQAAQRTVNSRSLTNHRRRRSPCQHPCDLARPLRAGHGAGSLTSLALTRAASPRKYRNARTTRMPLASSLAEHMAHDALAPSVALEH